MAVETQASSELNVEEVGKYDEFQIEKGKLEYVTLDEMMSDFAKNFDPHFELYS
ncbi:hypothetical protein IEO70_09840 [Bacillus sp. AGMB 02131]|uniref:Uncharacterized protein n=1 Tax=Peribacillus faecalis TaxID=2772559 RepID=A0A927HCQ2_9BACI|nr:hypothetical protein [Peribacillus faecalis]MBD3108668.1 hypothetical protein [Peribacillus faecalis]